jgi:hypothetical protein
LTKDLVNRTLPGMASFNIYEAKTQLSKLIRQVRAGQGGHHRRCGVVPVI